VFTTPKVGLKQAPVAFTHIATTKNKLTHALASASTVSD
jgi:hypothetical protein